MNTATDVSEDAQELDLRGLFAHIVLNRWWILTCVVALTVIFTAYAFLARPMYSVTAVLMPASTDQGMNVAGLASGPLASLASGLGIGGPHSARTEEALAVLQSRAFTEEFIADENLMPQLFPAKWNASTHQWKEPLDKRPTLAEAYLYFNKKIRTVTAHKRTGLITVQVKWTSSEEAANWINDLIERLNQEMRANAIKKADASLTFLRDRLKKASSVEVRSALGDLMQIELKKRMYAQVTPNYSLQFVAAPVGSDGAKPVWPKKLLLVVLGPLVGFFLGLLITLLRRHRLYAKL